MKNKKNTSTSEKDKLIDERTKEAVDFIAKRMKYIIGNSKKYEPIDDDEEA